MPHFVRAYGEILRREPDGLLEVFATLIGAVLLLLAVLTIGALLQGVVKAWRRASFHLTTTRPAARRSGAATGHS